MNHAPNSAELDDSAPEWLRAAGWIAAVVVGHLLLMNALAMNNPTGMLPNWWRIIAGTVCGQVTCLCILGLFGPGLLFWRLAGAATGIALAGVLAFLAFRGDQLAVIQLFVIQTAFVAGALLIIQGGKTLIRRIRSPEAHLPPNLSGQFSLNHLLGLICFVAVVCAIMVNFVIGNWQIMSWNSFVDYVVPYWGRGNAFLGLGLAASVLGVRDWLSKIGVSIGFFLGLTVVDLAMLIWIDGLVRFPGTSMLSLLCLQNGAQTIVVLATVFGLEQAGFVLHSPDGELESGGEELASSPDKSALEPRSDSATSPPPKAAG